MSEDRDEQIRRVRDRILHGIAEKHGPDSILTDSLVAVIGEFAALHVDTVHHFSLRLRALRESDEECRLINEAQTAWVSG